MNRIAAGSDIDVGGQRRMRFGWLQEAAMCGGARQGEECRGRPVKRRTKLVDGGLEVGLLFKF